MAKDPAFLFYSSDFLSGVSDLTIEERGQFITLLCLQHQKGNLSEKTICLSVGSVSVDVLKKFSKDENGNFYNVRLKKEIELRNNYTESRRSNGLQGGRPKNNLKPYDKPNKNHMVNHMEDENENENEDINTNTKFLIPKLFSEFKKQIPNYPGSVKLDYKPLQNIAQFILLQSKNEGSIIDNAENICTAWAAICLVIKEDNFYRQKSLSTISNHIQEILQNSLHGKRNSKISTDDLKAAHAKRYGIGQQG